MHVAGLEGAAQNLEQLRQSAEDSNQALCACQNVFNRTLLLAWWLLLDAST